MIDKIVLLVASSIGNVFLCVKEDPDRDFGHKMWDAAWTEGVWQHLFY